MSLFQDVFFCIWSVGVSWDLHQRASEEAALSQLWLAALFFVGKACFLHGSEVSWLISRLDGRRLSGNLGTLLWPRYLKRGALSMMRPAYVFLILALSLLGGNMDKAQAQPKEEEETKKQEEEGTESSLSPSSQGIN